MIVTVADAATMLVVNAKLTRVLPAGTVTLAGTAAAAGLLLESATAVPPAGAAPFSITVPVEIVPPVTVAVSRVREEIVASGGKVTKRTSLAWKP